jgi:group I intron endonuclease
MQVPGVYCLICTVTGDLYVGASAKSIASRWDAHKKQLRGGWHKNPHLQAAWRAYGEGAFLFSILEAMPTGDVWQAEIMWCQALKPRYNIAAPGQTPMQGRRHSEETRQRLREAGIRQFSDPAARAAAAEKSRGRPQTEEKKRKVAAFHTGRKRPPETGQRISASQRGKIVSAETAAKIKETRKRKPVVAIDSAGNETHFASATEAAATWFPGNTAARAHIRACCKGKMKTAYGHRWRYADS